MDQSTPEESVRCQNSLSALALILVVLSTGVLASGEYRTLGQGPLYEDLRYLNGHPPIQNIEYHRAPSRLGWFEEMARQLVGSFIYSHAVGTASVQCL